MSEVISIYMKKTSAELRRLRSQKVNRLARIEKDSARSYSTLVEIRTLKFQIGRIDTVLRMRADQETLL